MSVSAKLMLPVAFTLHPAQPAIEHAFGGMTTLFCAPPGYLLTDHMAGLLHDRQIPSIWLHLGTEDQDPGMLLSSLAGGIEAAFPGAGARTLQEMRRQPGPLFGWAPLFFGLARDLVERIDSSPTRPRLAERPAAYAPPVALVLQHVDSLLDSPPALELLWDHFLPFLPAAAARILTSHTSMPRGSVPGYVVRHGSRDLSLDDSTALARVYPGGTHLALSALSGVTSSTLRRVVTLAEGRGGALDGLFALAQLLPPAHFTHLVEGAHSTGELLTRAARAYLEASPSNLAGLLALSLRLEYIHPDLVQAALNEPISINRLPPGWFQPLADGWARLHCAWREPLRAALANRADLPRPALKQVVDCLLEKGAYEDAIPLLLDFGYLQEAAQVMVQVAEPLLDNGKWMTLSGWLARLPSRVRADWPWLVYAEGELSAASGQTGPARRIFATATRLFSDQKDYKGACRSLLTESSLAAWQDEMPRAEQFALQAENMARSANLIWYQGWAAWQLGVLAASSGQIAQALENFQEALSLSQRAEDPQMGAFFEQVHRLASTQDQLQQQVTRHLRAYQSALQAEREASARLRFWLENPLEQSSSLLQQYGWSQAPLFLKLPPPVGTGAGSLLLAQSGSGSPAAPEHFLAPERLLALVRGLLRGSAREPQPDHLFPPTIPATGYLLDPNLTDGAAPVRPLLAGQEAENIPAEQPSAAPTPTTAGDVPFVQSEIAPTAQQVQSQAAAEIGEGIPSPSQSDSLAAPLPAPDLTAQTPGDRKAEPVQPAAPVSSGRKPSADEPVTGALQGYLLGSFRVLLNGQAVESWPSGRGRALFAFLLSQRGGPLPREVIMDTFWPDASPESARNSLNVAVYGLRQALKSLTARQVIVFRENAYGLNPDIPIWLDSDAFERSVQAGQEAIAGVRPVEVGDHTVLAIHEYESALSLYQGDFLADFPYEDWAALERERLRVLYLETLDQLSLVYFNRGQYASCAALCQQMLARDNCREDAHCRLMRSYSRQGQGHLALRQYQACVESLRNELDVSPSPGTIQLFEQIRRRELV